MQQNRNFLIFLLLLLLWATTPDKSAHLKVIDTKTSWFGKKNDQIYHNYFLFTLTIKHGDKQKREQTITSFGILNHVFTCTYDISSSMYNKSP